MEHIDVFGVPVLAASRHEALVEIERVHDERAPALIAYANAHTLNLAYTRPEYREVLRAAALVLNDGAGIALAARFQKRRFPENLNGSDFNPLIVELAALRNWPVYFLGARDGVAEAAARILSERFSSLQVAGVHHGYFEDEADMSARIRAAGTDVLLVAMGNPLQEMFLHRNLSATGARLGVGVGAFFDFTTGIEWVYRLGQEPKRMWKRYVLGNPAFLWRVFAERVRS